MAEYTITIKDEDGGISIAMAGPKASESTAGQLAKHLLGVLPLAVAKIARSKAAPCDCDECKAARNPTPTKPTIH
ncbi:hypothetical protein [Pseudomonas sp. 9Ag]|uniref:hypothetical protein n=1 Tax=Pseudomonas sp. 9Ag TaxID=2653167 RepID=UPI0012EF8791|nr:hypothetical protein [Pseudomonas sp. 9Ag]VXD04010.1 conserved hypothetical protein [Pseudomonas sp. 9Ag]